MAYVNQQGEMATGDEKSFNEFIKELEDSIAPDDADLFGVLMVQLMMMSVGPIGLAYLAFQQGVSWERYQREHEESRINLDGIKGL